MEGHRDVVDYLIQAGADVRQADSVSTDQLHVDCHPGTVRFNRENVTGYGHAAACCMYVWVH